MCITGSRFRLLCSLALHDSLYSGVHGTVCLVSAPLGCKLIKKTYPCPNFIEIEMFCQMMMPARESVLLNSLHVEFLNVWCAVIESDNMILCGVVPTVTMCCI